MDEIKGWNDFFNKKLNEELNEFGIVNVHIDGEGFIKSQIINDIKKVLIKYQGERHLFIDGEEINPYTNGGGMG